jgi:PhnB protein
MSSPKPHGMTAHLFVRRADDAVQFYAATFGAVEVFRNVLPDGRLLFVELAVGPDRLLISEETPSLGAIAPPTLGGSPVLLLLEVDDPDEIVRRAVVGGAVEEMPVAEMFWGERYGVIRDPFGHRWAVSTVRQEYTPDDIASHTPPDLNP